MSAQDFGIKNATAIRQPATANLMLDSDDRNKATWPSPFNYTLQENQSIMNGFFTRIATTEAVVEWCENNINSNLDNNTIGILVSSATYNQTVSLTIPNGNYTISSIAEQITSQLNAISTTTGVGYALSKDNFGDLNLVANPGTATTQIQDSNLSEKLDSAIGVFGLGSTIIASPCADIRPYRYMDIVSESLGYCQKLKDNSTNGKPRNVLLRWYFDEDAPETLDGFGFPIKQGYIPFDRRRLYNPPKQLRWDPSQPVGQIIMRAYDEQGDIIVPSNPDKTNYLLTLQLSEN